MSNVLSTILWRFCQNILFAVLWRTKPRCRSQNRCNIISFNASNPFYNKPVFFFIMEYPLHSWVRLDWIPRPVRCLSRGDWVHITHSWQIWPFDWYSAAEIQPKSSRWVNQSAAEMVQYRKKGYQPQNTILTAATEELTPGQLIDIHQYTLE